MPDTVCIDRNFWDDWKLKDLDFLTKSVFVYLVLHKDRTSLGCLQKSLEDMCKGTGLSLGQITQSTEQCISHKLLLQGKDNWWFMPTYLEWQKPEYYVSWQSIKAALEAMPKDVDFVEELLSVICAQVQDIPPQELSILNGLQSLLKGDTFFDNIKHQ
ncbi:MAG: hypothetical protein COC15_01570 [Legionellales bacterium]|nr:MAG: hypothetical protein COC15_01570 [Legionellales bacterium]